MAETLKFSDIENVSFTETARYINYTLALFCGQYYSSKYNIISSIASTKNCGLEFKIASH